MNLNVFEFNKHLWFQVNFISDVLLREPTQDAFIANYHQDIRSY